MENPFFNMPMYFDVEGQPIEMMEWAVLMQSDDKLLRQENTTSGAWVSTVWLGLDHGFARVFNREAPPLIFETMAWRDPLREQVPGGWEEELCQLRWSTKEQAIAGHHYVVAHLESDLEYFNREDEDD